MAWWCEWVAMYLSSWAEKSDVQMSRMNDARYPILDNRIRDIEEDSQGNIYVGWIWDSCSMMKHHNSLSAMWFEEDPFNWVYAVRESVNKGLSLTTYTATYIATPRQVFTPDYRKEDHTTGESLAKSNKEKALLENIVSAKTLQYFMIVETDIYRLAEPPLFSTQYKETGWSPDEKVWPSPTSELIMSDILSIRIILKGEVMLTTWG